ncbi:Minimal nucleotidyltransferase (plasmid) [Halanaeroarchaeum sp. HSR-CO]|uniref:nucleotidyltransferase domain-containing protein n=1 Tax=Halanaeroarchaeum sp. HSR-CO TaxID=2866382 RepID=UPI00217DD56F|nr:nucleotidyltransferase domain-containing protein [Halanaeroarchaeum sp. HSR-CO]UWG49160.1 Minimal nucleotidyltransferase [Halanaeroarchaeum sp. HSR-CO]
MNDKTESGISISVSIPAKNTELYGSRVTDDILLFLSRNRFEEFTQREVARHLDEASETTVRRVIATLAENELVTVEDAGNKKLVQINRQRLSVSDDPFLQIPQEEFQWPVKVATHEIEERLDGVSGVVLYGSVARGEADRRSDIDLWVLVDEERAEQQRMASYIEDDLEDREFDGERYDFHIAVESIESLPAFTEDISRIVRSGIPTSKTENFETLRNLFVHGDHNE